MAIGIGIDTGGTYTDAVVYDYDTNKVLAKGKSPTTHHELSIGIGKALDMLPEELLKKAKSVSLSTTLATNACVEDRGGRAHLLLMGTKRSTLEWLGADKKYGFSYDDVLCLDTKSSFDGKRYEHPDWDKILTENEAFFKKADAISVAELNAPRNGAVMEKLAEEKITEIYKKPFIAASELVSDLDLMERGATALLNARLLPVIDRFREAVKDALEKRGLDAKRMIVRSDGSLMTDEHASSRPVETILSGPAASVIGTRALAQADDCLIIDMGGTTTDISIVKNNFPYMSGGISIGGWRTQIKGVFIDTFGLGGDTRVYLKEGQLTLDSRRVEPLCAAAAKWPKVKEELKKLYSQARFHTQPLHEFLYLLREPKETDELSEAQTRLVEKLRGGIEMIGGETLGIYVPESDALEKMGIVMRCGLTPTDIMHIKGDHVSFDTQASLYAAKFFIGSMDAYKNDEEDHLSDFCDEVYELVKHRLFVNIARIFLETKYPDIFKKGADASTLAIIEKKWESRNEKKDDKFFELDFNVSAPLIGTGAPTHIFLPDVAKYLGTKAIIPKHSEVANAVGAAVANIVCTSQVMIRADYHTGGLGGYIVYARDSHEKYPDKADAIEAAKAAALKEATQEARLRGAKGELKAEFSFSSRGSRDKEGSAIDLGTTVIARVSGRMEV
ncbi:MAG: hydantoinase/oxoprolinase family protein [Clostridiales bacterium]|nr:hydantoinase/oxoprolinase family protein [Clostridiales bacterium]